MLEKSYNKNQLKFTGSWIVALCLLLSIFVLCRLGYWQLDRADQKRYNRAVMKERLLNAPVAINSLPITPAGEQWYLSNKKQAEAKDVLEWRRVLLKGSYINEKNLFNQGTILSWKIGL